MLGMGLVLQHLLHRGRTGHADTLAPGNEPLGRPLRMVLVTLRQVLGHGGEPAFMGTAHVAGHPIATVQGFDRMGRHPQLQRQTHQGVGHAVAVAFKLDVAVDVHPHRFEHPHSQWLHRQGHQGRGVDLGKHAGAVAGQFLKRTLVEPLQQGRNGVVDFFDTGELVFAQARQYPALHQQHAQFHLGLVLRVVGACGQY
jgi:hypothetical protein